MEAAAEVAQTNWDERKWATMVHFVPLHSREMVTVRSLQIWDEDSSVLINMLWTITFKHTDTLPSLSGPL